MPDYLSGMIRNLVGLNTLGQQQAQTQQTQVETAILNKRLQVENDSSKALASLAAARDNVANQQGPSNLADLQGVADARPIFDGYKQETQNAQFYTQAAKEMYGAGNLAMGKDFEEKARHASDEAKKWQDAGIRLQKDRRDQMAATAASLADDGSNLEDVKAKMLALDPKSLQGPQFDRDQSTGEVIMGPKTKQAIDNKGRENLNASESLRLKAEQETARKNTVMEEQRRVDEKLRQAREDRMAAAQQHGMEVMDRRLAMAESREKDSKTTTDPDLLVSRGAMVASGVPIAQAVPGWGTKATNERAAAQKEAIRQITDEDPNMTKEQAGKELAQRQIDYFANRRSTTQLNTMLGATKQAVGQLEINANKVQEIVKTMPSTDLSPVLNSIIRKEQYWTGDPKYSQLYFFMHAMAMESARILQGGQASIAQLHQGAAEEAKKWADIGLTPAMIGGVVESIKYEGHARIKTYQDAMKSQGLRGDKEETTTPSTGAPQPGAVESGYKFKGGDPAKKENWEKV